MSPDRRLTRVFGVLVAALQLVTATAASIADAKLQGKAPTSVTGHIEGESSRDCAPVHARNCAICQVISSRATPATAANATRAVDFAPDRPPADVVAAPRPSIARAVLPRGPPVS